MGTDRTRVAFEAGRCPSVRLKGIDASALSPGVMGSETLLWGGRCSSSVHVNKTRKRRETARFLEEPLGSFIKTGSWFF